ncbi:MAG: universal stress protein UspA [Peptostreptococcaceae bacterium]|nr:universal stress protein UspA [Peptostreptococcaceae bacterium]
MEKSNVMVCVTDQKKCDRLIYNAMEQIDEKKSDIFVIHILKNSVITDEESGEALEYLIHLCNQFKASVSILKADNIKEALLKFAKEHRIHKIIMGESRNADPKTSVIYELKDELGDATEIVVVPTK